MAEDLRKDADPSHKARALPGPDRSTINQLVPMLESAFAEVEGIESLAYFTEGNVDFLVNGTSPEPGLSGQEWAEKAEQLAEKGGRPGRGLINWMNKLDKLLTRFNTGNLMRLVVAAPGGGCQVGRIRGGIHVVGITKAGEEAVVALDDRMNRLVADIRLRYGLPDELPGGLPCPGLEPPRPTDMPRFGGSLDGLEFQRFQAAWQDHLHAEDLEYVIYYRDWNPVCWGDVFDGMPSDSLTDISEESRRDLYRNLSQEFRHELAELREQVFAITGSRVTRIVLDVQEGAVYLHWLNSASDDFLMGVTLRQTAVRCAEARLRLLATRLENEGLI